jgi:hypothetical protein
LAPAFLTAQSRDERVAVLERQLQEARTGVAALQKTIETLGTELEALRQPAPASAILPSSESSGKTEPPPQDAAQEYRNQLIRPDLGEDERKNKLSGRPELFIQSRFQALPISGTTQEVPPSNFNLTRMESRWSGRLSDRIGMGFEIQYHPAPAGAAVELVNDAFVEYYVNDSITVRGGQFVKPFGFDIQQSSSTRESPERGMFAGYFFPGQRDRGVMVMAKLDGLGDLWHGTQVFAAALNGNRFFVDNNRQVNYNIRLRKVFDSVPLAIGISAQLGHQLLPDGVSGNNHENLYGADVQWAWRRLGMRAEFVAGNMPSTLLGLSPEFAPSFRPGAHSVGGSLFASFRLAKADQIYGRYDQFNGDPVSAKNIRAFNFGYFHHIGENSRLGVDYQFKNRASFNDDLLNTRLQIVWNVVY